MPKVNEDYLQKKRDEILDAAFEVCRRKPAYDVTMSDIVAETEMSQGGVYKYFNNIYSVYAALVDRANRKGDRIERIDRIMASEALPEEKIKALFEISGDFFSDMLISYNKILFELSSFSMQNPDQGKMIDEQTTVMPVFPYLLRCVSEVIMTSANEGYFEPLIPANEILAFLVASFDGIIRDVTLNKCYHTEAAEVSFFDETKLISCLYLSTMNLLGKNEIKNKSERNET